MKNIKIMQSIFLLCISLLSGTVVLGQTTIYSQDFEGTFPWGMTATSLNGQSYSWGSSSSFYYAPTGSTGSFALANSGLECDMEWDVVLTAPALDFTIYDNVELNFNSYFTTYFGYSYLNVEISTNGGSSWTVLHTEAIYEDNNVVIDLDAYSGMSNVLIRWRYVDDIGCEEFWGIDDIEIVGDLLGACAAPPNAGAAATANATVCDQATLTLSGADAGIGMTYQWQTSLDSFVWTDIAGATSSSTTQPVSGTVYFRAILTCSGQSDTSTAVTVTSSFTVCYCMPTYTYDCSGDYTSNVTFNSINNSSTCGGSTPTNYSDYTALTTSVVKGVTYPLSVTTGGDREGIAVWIDYDHSGTFDASELVLNGFANTNPATYSANVQIPATALSGTTIMRVRNRYNGNITAGQSCATFSYGETEHYSINIVPPPADEAGVTAITRPSLGTCSLGNELWVQLENLGTNDLTSATFAVQVAGLTVATNPWTGLVPAGSSLEVQVPMTYAFADGDSISVTVSNPNGQPEGPQFTFNNHIGRRVYTALSGNKTVYGTGADYANLNAAIADLQLKGACDTVYFKIASGSYTTSHTFGAYLAAGAGKLAVFESATGNAADVVFEVATTSTTNYVFSFNNARYYALRNVTAKSTGTSYGGVIDLRGDVDHIELGNNFFQGDTTSTSVSGNFNMTLASTAYQTGNDYDDIWIHDNIFVGGARSVDFELANDRFSNLVIENNAFRSYGLLGVLTLNTNDIQLKNNKFTARTGITANQSGAQIIYSYGGGDVSGNDINLPAAGFGVLLSDIPTSSNSLVVSNNFVYTGDTSLTGISFGIYVEEYDIYTGNVNLVNNSLSFRSKNTSNAAIYVDSGNEISIVNNNIGSFNTAPGIFVSNANSISQVSNNNIWGSSLAQIGGMSYATLAALQSSSYGANSLSVNPGFNGTDLHTCAVALNGAALSLAYVVVDIDGDVRGTAPDIGADEFLADAANLLADDHVLKCPAVQVTLGNTAVNGVTYSWTPAGSSSEITATAAGNYVVTATSSCGTYSDTVVVELIPLPDASFTSVNVGLTGIFTNTSTNATTYLWEFGDGQTSTDQNPSHVYASAGTYSVKLFATNECGTDEYGPMPINVINAIIEEDGANVSVQLFPNPTDGMFTIAMANMLNEASVIQIVDVAGKVVFDRNLVAGQNQITLDATSFASGVYSIRISNGNIVKVVRFVKK